jgi:hypothetical protein
MKVLMVLALLVAAVGVAAAFDRVVVLEESYSEG